MNVDVRKLRAKMAETGMTQAKLAEEIGIDTSTFNRKINANGLTFTIKQMHNIVEALEMSPLEAQNIFLCRNSH